MYLRVKRKRLTVFLQVEPTDTVLEVKQKLQQLVEQVRRTCWGVVVMMTLCVTSRTRSGLFKGPNVCVRRPITLAGGEPVLHFWFTDRQDGRARLLPPCAHACG